MSPELSKLKLGHPSHAAEIFAWLPVTAHFEQEKQNKIKNIEILFRRKLYYETGNSIFESTFEFESNSNKLRIFWNLCIIEDLTFASSKSN